MMPFRECACCGSKTLEAGSAYNICPVCGWEDDPIQNKDSNYEGGANHISLNIAQQAFAEGKSLGPLKKAAYRRLEKEEADREKN
jgi:hypothetical protein